MGKPRKKDRATRDARIERRLERKVAGLETELSVARWEIDRALADSQASRDQARVLSEVVDRLTEKFSAEAIIAAVADLVNPRPMQPWQVDDIGLPAPPSPALAPIPFYPDVELDDSMETTWQTTTGLTPPLPNGSGVTHPHPASAGE